jgi:hypothetical protein
MVSFNQKETFMPIRPATLRDVSIMIAMSEAFRTQLQQYQPVFWRKAADSAEKQTPYFEKLVQDESVITLVHETDTKVDGFIIAGFMEAPPVYNPAGLTCLVDDFCVDEWATTGRALLDLAMEEAKARGAVQIVVICPHLDEAKRAMLRGKDLTIASEWYVRGI